MTSVGRAVRHFVEVEVEVAVAVAVAGISLQSARPYRTVRSGGQSTVSSQQSTFSSQQSPVREQSAWRKSGEQGADINK